MGREVVDWYPSQLLAWPLKCARLAAIATTKRDEVEGHLDVEMAW